MTLAVIDHRRLGIRSPGEMMFCGRSSKELAGGANAAAYSRFPICDVDGRVCRLRQGTGNAHTDKHLMRPIKGNRFDNFFDTV
jgi:hypothetical protein